MEQTTITTDLPTGTLVGRHTDGSIEISIDNTVGSLEAAANSLQRLVNEIEDARREAMQRLA